MKHLLCLTLLSAWLSATSMAGTITWGNNPADLIYDINGSHIPDGTATWTFALGTFGTAFTPDATNTADWWTNWKPLDSGTGITGGTSGSGNYSSPSGFGGDYITDGFNLSFTSGHLVSSDSAATFTGGEKVYTWIYNDTSMVAGLSQWGLYSHSSWVLPTSTNPDTVAGFDAQWRLDGPGGDFSVTPIWGSLYAQTSATSEDIILSDQQSTPDFGLQLATIPEPSSLILFLGAACAAATRRRRL